MCRHLAYLGSPRTLRALLCEPPHGLYRQAWAPRFQRYGTVNADGFGVGWYVPGDPVPARYRRAVPIWADPSFDDLVRVTRSGCVLAAVRSATPGTARDESAAAPYAAGPWLFSHNGSVAAWPGSVAALAAGLAPEALLDIEARCDSAFLWALVKARLLEGTPPGEALAAVVSAVTALTPARLNLLLTDGSTVAATTYGDTLSYRVGPDGALVVASEPDDAGSASRPDDAGSASQPDDAGSASQPWIDVPDRRVVVGGRDGVAVSPL
ncbi:MAG: ergothioneine biosynthesis protein EgtC [Streptomycetales bacterium]